MPESLKMVGGSVLMIVGVALVITAMFRALGDNWPLRGHQRWALPVLGISLMALGHWFLP